MIDSKIILHRNQIIENRQEEDSKIILRILQKESKNVLQKNFENVSKSEVKFEKVSKLNNELT